MSAKGIDFSGIMNVFRLDSQARGAESRSNVTVNSSFKSLVRARMEQTGQNYTSARADLLAEKSAEIAEQREQALAEHLLVVGRFFKGNTFTVWPAKRKPRAHALLFLVNFFEPGRVYAEKEVNHILGNLWSDFAFLRREMVEYGYFQRNSVGEYWLARELESREGTILHPETPAWENHWLPDYLAGRTEKISLS